MESWRSGLIGRHVLIGALVTLSLAPSAAARAQHLPGGGAGSVLLRYRFVPGQRFTYQVMTIQQIVPVPSSATDTGQLGAAASIIAARVNGTTTDVLSGQLHEHVLSVDQDGVARIALTIDHLLAAMNGEPPSPRSGQSLGIVMVAPDGRQRGNAASSAVDSGPILPSYPVSPGSRWSNTVKVLVPGVVSLVRSGASEDTFERFAQAGGEPVAVISAVIPLRAEADITLGHVPVHVEETGLETLELSLGLDSGQVVYGHGRINARLSIQQDGSLLQTTILVDTSQRRVGQ